MLCTLSRPCSTIVAMNRLRRCAFLLTSIAVLLGTGLAARVDAQATYNVIASLDGFGARRPMGGVIKASNGTLYGTAYESAALAQCGGIYKVATDGTLSVLHAFTGDDGCHPVGELVEGADGHLYGTTYLGGPNVDTFLTGTGTVFKISMPDETFSMIHAFAAFDSVNGWYPEGFAPFGGLALGNDNNLYGTTTSGGARNPGGTACSTGGTVFRITPDGDLTVLHSLVPDTDGCGSNAGLNLGSDGNFYGTTVVGGGPLVGGPGTIFRVTPAGAFTTLFVFAQDPACACWSDGFLPTSEPVDDGVGNLYGTASAGGIPTGTESGTVWKLSPSGELTVLKSFTGSGAAGTDGSFPTAGLTLGADGNLYGTAASGGEFGHGTVFSVTPTGTHTVLHSFDLNSIPGGGVPDGRLIETSPGVFVGTTQLGGTSGAGVVFQLTLTPDATNRPPVASDGTATVTAGASVSGTLSASDPDGDALTYAIVANGSKGTAVVTNASTGAYTYTANSGTSGEDTFTFQVTDSRGLASNVATVTVAIQPPPTCAVNVTSSIQQVKGKGSKSSSTTQSVSLENVSSSAITGPISLALDSLTAGVTLVNAAGVTSYGLPAGSPYVNVNVGTDAVWSPGERVEVILQFSRESSGPGKKPAITYTRRVLAGAGGR
jgi:uncharacterized repeat protein (TIGR03803 family)